MALKDKQCLRARGISCIVRRQGHFSTAGSTNCPS